MAKVEIIIEKGRPAPKATPRKPLTQRVAKTQVRVRVAKKRAAGKA